MTPLVFCTSESDAISILFEQTIHLFTLAHFESNYSPYYKKLTFDSNTYSRY